MRFALLAVALITAASWLPANAQEVKIDTIIVARSVPAAQRDTTLKAAKAFDNWHIEDNLTLLTQMGVAKVEQ